MNPARAVFFDRDGVLNPDVGFPHMTRDAVLFPDVVPSLRRIQDAGYRILVVTNQSGVGRRLFPLSAAIKFNESLRRQLDAAGIRLAKRDFYVCPHVPEDHCDCRKPAPGLLLKAAKDHNLGLGNSLIVGDKETDVLTGHSVGALAILLKREKDRRRRRSNADLIVSDLYEAADFICGLQSRSQCV